MFLMRIAQLGLEKNCAKQSSSAHIHNLPTYSSFQNRQEHKSWTRKYCQNREPETVKLKATNSFQSHIFFDNEILSRIRILYQINTILGMVTHGFPVYR